MHRCLSLSVVAAIVAVFASGCSAVEPAPGAGDAGSGTDDGSGDVAVAGGGNSGVYVDQSTATGPQLLEQVLRSPGSQSLVLSNATLDFTTNTITTPNNGGAGFSSQSSDGYWSRDTYLGGAYEIVLYDFHSGNGSPYVRGITIDDGGTLQLGLIGSATQLGDMPSVGTATYSGQAYAHLTHDANESTLSTDMNASVNFASKTLNGSLASATLSDGNSFGGGTFSGDFGAGTVNGAPNVTGDFDSTAYGEQNSGFIMGFFYGPGTTAPDLGLTFTSADLNSSFAGFGIATAD